MIRVGLRFQQRDAPLLAHLAERVRSGDLGPRDVATFASAATAARTGEPLLVYCEDAAEAAMVAAGYALYGVTLPTIDEVAPTGL